MVRVSNAIWKLDRINLQKNKMSSFPMFGIFVSLLYNGCYWCKVKIKALNLVIFLITLKLRYSDYLNNNLVQYLYGTRISIAEWSRFWIASEYKMPKYLVFEWQLNTRPVSKWKKQNGLFYYLNTRQKVSENGNVRFQMVFGIQMFTKLMSIDVTTLPII